MNAFLNPRSGATSNRIIDVTAHNISLFQENEQPKNITEIFIPRTSMSIAEPIGVQIGELGNNIFQMYQLIGIINDGKVPGLESVLNDMKIFFSKDDPAINEHHYHIILKNNTTKRHITYTIQIKPKHIILTIICMYVYIYIYVYTDGHYYNKTRNVNNNITNNTNNKSITSNNEHVLNL